MQRPISSPDGRELHLGPDIRRCRNVFALQLIHRRVRLNIDPQLLPARREGESIEAAMAIVGLLRWGSFSFPKYEMGRRYCRLGVQGEIAKGYDSYRAQTGILTHALAAAMTWSSPITLTTFTRRAPSRGGASVRRHSLTGRLT